MLNIFYRFKQGSDIAQDDIDVQVIDMPTEPIAVQPSVTPQMQANIDPVHKAILTQIALVSVEENAQLPALLSETAQSQLVRWVRLPRNPRIAGDELFALDGIDMMVIVTDESKSVDKYTLRWLELLKQFNTPIIVLLPYEVKKRREQDRLNEFAQRIGLPVMSVTSDNLETARREFVEKTMQIAPATGLALGAHMAYFREPLMHNLLTTATEDGLVAHEVADIEQVKMELVRHICAAHGCNGQRFEQHRIALETLIKTMTHYTEQFINRLPMRDPQRRTRFVNALSTLFIGYATAIHLGATPPTFRKELLPQVWRLYRASGQSVRE